MLTNKDFLHFINDKSLDNSLEERLNTIIDEELEKPEEIMDTELIEYCLDKLIFLNEQSQAIDKEVTVPHNKRNRTSKKFKRTLFIAAAIVLLLVGTLSASAIFDVDSFNGVVEFYNDYIRINFKKAEDRSDVHRLLDTELAKELANNGFNEVLLPEALLSEEFEITKIEYESGEFINSANIIFKYKRKSGSVFITKFATTDLVPDIDFLNITSKVEKIELDNTTIYCFMQNDITSINYMDGLVQYTIQVPMELDDAIEFAKTIK